MAKEALTRQSPGFGIEQDFGAPVCGIDEAGRGPLAGPVIAACVYIPEDVKKLSFWRDVDDSKKLNARKRDDLFSRIRHYCAFGIGAASVEEIDSLNIHHATLLAMRRAFEGMNAANDFKPCMVLVDGKFTPEIGFECKAIVDGDALSLSIAAASIIAKVTRDRMMAELDREFPAYGWAKNAGYGTKAHLTALKAHGVTPHHRRSYAPVRDSL